MHEVYVSLGGNQGDPISCFMMTLRHFQNLGHIRGYSGIYQTEPQGGPVQPDYFNAVFSFTTDRTCHEVLREAQQCERACKRVRTMRFGPRTLDVDILLYDDLIMDSENLVLPHPRMHLRRFVLEPLSEIAPGIVVPGKGNVTALIPGVLGQRVTRIRDWEPEILDNMKSTPHHP